MNAAEYELAVELFLRACDLPPAERGAILAEADRPEIRTLVERMLEEEGRWGAESTFGDVVLEPDGALELGLVSPEARRDATLTDEILTDCGRYSLDREIARGGVGAILRGRDLELGRELAIKVLLDSNRENPEAVQRLITEAQIGGQLQHPGIAPVYDVGQLDGDRPFFAMKLVKGKTLASVLAERSDSLEERSRLLAEFRQVCLTVAYAHSRGVIHRDLKPENIMIGRFGEVQVMDWGLAKVLSPSQDDQTDHAAIETEAAISVIKTLRTPDETGDDSTKTKMGSVMGTLAYMAPEQAMGEVDKIDERADVFGLGAILCQIITGQPPYVEDSGSELLRAAIAGRLDRCFERLDSCGADSELVDLTKACLAPESKSRLRHAGIVADRISSYLESVDARVRQAELNEAQQRIRTQQAERVAEAAEARTRAERRARRLQLMMGGVILVGCLVGTAFLSVYLGEQRKHIRVIEAQQLDLAKAQVDALRTAVPGSVPFLIDSMRPSRSMVLPVLREVFADSGANSAHRLHAALALVALGERSDQLADFIVRSAADAPPSEAHNIISACESLGDACQSSTMRALLVAEREMDWRYKARLAIVELQLHRAGPASDMLQHIDRSDPSQRTAFINVFPAWHGDLATLAESDRWKNAAPALLSGICLAVGSVRDPSDRARKAWQSRFHDWYLNHADSGTHSAAAWALQDWMLEPPTPPSAKVDADRPWKVSPAGLTLIRIPSGEFVRENSPGQLQTVKIAADFWISDREITVERFNEFITDNRYPGRKPSAWEGPDKEVSLSGKHPVQRVNWNEAVAFCNWLSWREGLEPCYDRKEIPATDRHDRADQWHFIESANGYHLPSEAQWEYACRAGTTTAFSFGENPEYLADYAVYKANSGSRTAPGGSKMCNAWGLFDMHGNVREWCYDWEADYSGGETMTNPLGPSNGIRRVHRGGSWNAPTQNCQSHNRYGTEPTIREDFLGFRVAR